MSKTNMKVVRMLELAVNMSYSTASFDGKSGLKPGRSEHEARGILKKLKQLAEIDSNNKFGTYFTRLMLKLLKHLNNSGR